MGPPPVGVGRKGRLQLRPDRRRSAEAAEGLGRCRRCGARIIVLPDDRRRGYCFECYDPLEVRSGPSFP